MANPIYEERKENLEFIEVASDILRNSRNELYLNMRFLDVALSVLSFVPDEQAAVSGTDGTHLFFHPEGVAALFRQGREMVNRQYLHTVLHCLFSHLWAKKDREEQLWDLACDIAVEYVMDDLHCRAVHRPPSAIRREYYRMLRQDGVVTAQKIYHQLDGERKNVIRLERLRQEFTVDDHRYWERERKQKTPSPREQQWDDIRDRMQTEMETFSKEASEDSRSLEEQICAQNRKRYDYRAFLRKFSVLKEEMQVDLDSFDYSYYNYGMSLYGNMPLIEPLETKEVQKVEDFVIVLDTSMSCKGELIRRFLEETYSVLSESEGFFRRIHVHILQCDDKVQEDVLVTSQEEMQEYLEHFTVRGFGGTDFRPAFVRVQELLAQKCFTKLRGLIYFTDGYGTFPVKKPPYETAFVFMKNDYRDVDVPPWAIKLIIDPEELLQDEY
jgi:predicted metal-dependent peptidase